MRKTVLLLALAFVFSLAAVAFAADEPPKAAEAPKYGMEVNQKAAPVQLKGIGDAKGVDTAALKKDTVFVLVSSVCTACMAEMRELAANIDKFDAFEVYAVVIDMDPERAAGNLAKFKIPMLSDADWKLGGVTGLSSSPSTVVLAKDGTIKYKTFGYKANQWKDFVGSK